MTHNDFPAAEEAMQIAEEAVNSLRLGNSSAKRVIQCQQMQDLFSRINERIRLAKNLEREGGHIK